MTCRNPPPLAVSNRSALYCPSHLAFADMTCTLDSFTETSSSACTPGLPVSAWSHRPGVILATLFIVIGRLTGPGWVTHVILVRILILVVVLAQVILVLIVLVEILVQLILVNLLIGECLAREPVNGTGDELLLDVLAQLVVQLQAVLDVGRGIIILLCRGLRGREEVEKGVGRDSLLDDAGLLGVCAVLVFLFKFLCYVLACRHDSLLLRCFFCSTRTVRSFSAFQLILSPWAWS